MQPENLIQISPAIILNYIFIAYSNPLTYHKFLKFSYSYKTPEIFSTFSKPNKKSQINQKFHLTPYAKIQIKPKKILKKPFKFPKNLFNNSSFAPNSQKLISQ